MNISPYAKAVESGLGNAILVGTFVTTCLTEIAPNNTALAWSLSALSVALGAANTFRVWLVKNEPVIEAAVEAADELVHDFEEGRHSLGSSHEVEPVAVVPQIPQGSVVVPPQAPGFVPGPGARA